MKKVLAAVLFISMVQNSAWSFGLGMRFVDVTLERVEPGVVVNLRVLKSLPLVLTNKDKENGIEVVVENVLPNHTEMREGYEPIPDPSWVKIVPARFHLGPGASASADVILTIPDDKKLVGRHFESIIWAHTDRSVGGLVRNGVMLEAGIRSRFRMSIGTMGPEALQREKALKKIQAVEIAFSLAPDTIFVQDIPLGKKIDLKSEKKASFKLINQADNDVELKSAAVPTDRNVIPQGGYEYAPDPKWLEITPSRAVFPGNSVKEIRMKLHIPDKPEYRGKKYMFLINTELADDSLPIIYRNMLYVSTVP